MSELHWTGAALLLAAAVLSRGAARPRRDVIVNWTDFAREHGLAADPAATGTRQAASAATSDHAPRPRGARVAPLSRSAGSTEPRRLRQRASATCAHCSRTAGDLEWDAAAPWQGVILRPAGGGAAQPVPTGTRLRCAHCGGPVFADEPEAVRECPAKPAPARRGRPRKSSALKAS